MNSYTLNNVDFTRSSDNFTEGLMRINTLNQALKKEFGEKVVKLSIDAGFTCPNRDGSKGFGGCTFCSSRGSGDKASTIDDQIALLSVKWPNAKYLAYFQNYTGTYAPVSKLRELYYGALDDSRILGLAIATRSDCIDDECLKLLDEINKEYFLWVELGLQTIHEDSARRLNLCHTLGDYDETISKLNALNIRTVTHLILGLPGESKHDMKMSVRHAIKSNTWGLKLHLLNMISGTKLAKDLPDYLPFESMDEYAELVCDLLEIIPYNMVMHRLSADSPAKILIAPKWAYRKRLVLNTINQKLKDRDSWQGKFSGKYTRF